MDEAQAPDTNEQPGEQAAPVPQGKEVVHSFRITPDEDAKLTKLVEYAHESGYITKPNLSQYVIFVLNCTYKLLAYDLRRNTLNPDQQKLLDKVLKEQG
jgi:hypothetical protein